MAAISTEAYKSALREARSAFDAARRRQEQLAEEQLDLADRVSRLRRTITALAALCSESPWGDTLGITDACTEVMNVQKGLLTTAEVMEALENIGFDLATQKNAAASVHSVLSRLQRKGKIEKVEEEGGTVRWRGPNYDPLDDDIPF